MEIALGPPLKREDEREGEMVGARERFWEREREIETRWKKEEEGTSQERAERGRESSRVERGRRR